MIKCKNYEKQIPIPFKNYAYTECLLKRINISEGRYTSLYKKHIPNSIGISIPNSILICIDNKFTSPTKIFTGDNCINKFIKWTFEKQIHCNQIINEHFNKKLKMAIENEQKYQDSNYYWICNERVLVVSIKDIVKQIISIVQIMIRQNLKNILLTLI